MRLRILSALLWLVCASHLTLGLAGVLSPSAAIAMVRIFYGAQLDATPVVVHLLRILGAYMIAVGALGGAAAWDPEKHRPFVLAVALLLAIRVLERVLLVEEIHATFGVSTLRIWMQSGYFAVLAGALVFLAPRKSA